jgi:antitoxin component of MazEF toxin-antitoxin module
MLHSAVKIVKIRRLGNSNVVVIPSELQRFGYTPGASVVVEAQPDGELRIIPADRVRELIRNAGRQVIEEDREALEILQAHDRARELED